MEKNHDSVAIEVAALEEERTNLANQVANQVDSESEAEGDGEPRQDKPNQPEAKDSAWSPGPNAWNAAPKAQPRASNKNHRLNEMSEEELDQLLSRAKREIRRRLANTQSSEEPTQDDDEYEEDDDEM